MNTVYDNAQTVQKKMFCRTNRTKCLVLSNVADLTATGDGMAKRSIDRRVARTRAALQQALHPLILKKGYEAITIKDICDAADVGRSTFYAHFKSKDDLMRSHLEPLRKLLVDRQRDALATTGDIKDRRFGFSAAMFEHASDHRRHYRALVGGRGGTVSLGAIRRILADLVRSELATTAGKKSANAIPHELVVQYVVGAFMAVLTWWLDGSAQLPPQQINAMFRRLATEGIVSSFFLTNERS